MDDQAEEFDFKIFAATGKAERVRIINPRGPKEKAFEPRWIEVPTYWRKQLEKYNSAAMYQLALRILRQHFLREYHGGEIILSKEMTGLASATRRWATAQMVEAGMIQTEQQGNEAPRVVKLLHMHPKRKQS